MIDLLGPIAPNSIEYLVFTSGLVLLAWSPLRPYFAYGLTLVSLVMFLSWLEPGAVLVAGIMILAPYFGIRRLWGREDRSSFAFIACLVVLQVGLFLVIKRYNWFDILGAWGYPITVIGVSYILFRQIHLVLIAPRSTGLPMDLMNYAAYLLSLWTLIAGPIQRYPDFVRGLEEIGPIEKPELLRCGHRVASGLLKAFVIAPLFLEPSRVTHLAQPDADWIDLIVVFYGYPIYLYLNFSGYVDIVIGAARFCGFNTIPENFNRPYLARNSQDFWERWHMSFSSWIRHYIFIPISTAMMRRTEGRSQAFVLIVSVLVTFLIVGAWHGNTLNFIVFGIAQGLGVIVAGLYGGLLTRMIGADGRNSYNQSRTARISAIVLCLHFNCATFLFLNNTVADITKSLSLYFS